MKRYLSALALVLTLSATQLEAAPKHRNHQPTTAVATPDSASAATMGIEAYSDTTMAAESADTIIEEGSSHTVVVDSDSVDDAIEHVWKSIGWGAGGVAIGIFAVLMLCLLALLPLIIAIILLRFLIKRHNDKVELAEKAMAAGQPIPESMKPVDKQTERYLWQRGVRNVALGCGLALMFTIWSSSFLAGIGALVACYGAGQMVIARTSPKNHEDHND